MQWLSALPSRSEIIIKGAFANQAPYTAACPLIYAEDNAKITNGSAAHSRVRYSAWTLNCNDNDAATITVKGGSFYKLAHPNVTVGEGRDHR